MKVFPSKKRFIEDCENYNLIPVFTTVKADMDTSLTIFMKAGGEFLLESVENVNNVGRYSIISQGKKMEFRLKGNSIDIAEFEYNRESSVRSFTTANPLEKIREYFADIEFPDYPGLPPFSGGAIGYLGYETVKYFEDINTDKEDILNIPDGLLVVPEKILVFDSVSRSVHIIVLTTPGYNPAGQYENAVESLRHLKARLEKPVSTGHTYVDPDGVSKVNMRFPKKDFIKAVKKCKQHIVDGDIIQVVLSQQFSIHTNAPALELYRTLRMLNPSPYLYFLDFGDFQIIGSSPEVMVRLEGRELLLKPIAGTRKRGSSQEEDEFLAKDLLSDPKERAEHLMLVDLGRNDLGRISEPGSVEVSDFMSIEMYSHVMHIVSTVHSHITGDHDAFDSIRATFPAGTLSGAPKVRAMEIISELEPHKRGPYGGMVLNLAFNGNMNSCITIRTLVLKDGEATIQAGAGLVADSDPVKEYEECINKARALVKAVRSTHKGT